MALCTEHPAIARAGGQLYSRLTDKSSMNTAVQDVVATILQQTKFLDDPNIDADMACGNRIDFGAFHREICTLWICLPTTRLEEQKKWLRLIMNIALTEMMEEAPTFDATLPPVLYLLDEFGNLGNLSQIKKALNMSRDLSIQIFALLQNLAQLTSTYPNDEWTSFWSGAGAKISFQTGDSKTNDELVKLFGNREEYVETQGANGVSIAPQSVPLIRPEDISRLAPGETISVIEPCTMPIKGFAPVYPKTPWAESLDPNPYYRGKP
jgi:type IV secretion system protein VirD4